MSPRPLRLDDGAKVGYGLLAFISGVSTLMIIAVLVTIAKVWAALRGK